MSEESIAKIFGGPIVSERVFDDSIRVDAVGDFKEGGQKYLSSTPVKSGSGVEVVADSSHFPSESPLKPSAGVEVVISEKEELMCEVAQSGESKKKSNEGYGSRIRTSTGELTTEIGLAELDEIVDQGLSTSHFPFLLFGGAYVGCELLPREELIAREDFHARSN